MNTWRNGRMARWLCAVMMTVIVGLAFGIPDWPGAQARGATIDASMRVQIVQAPKVEIANTNPDQSALPGGGSRTVEMANPELRQTPLVREGVLMAQANPVGSAVLSAPPGKLNLWQMMIPVAVPIVIKGLKALAPRMPKGWIPLIAPALGAGVEYLLHFSGVVQTPGLGAILGAAGVGLRELLDQVKQGNLTG